MTCKSFSGYIKYIYLFVLISLCAACSINHHYNPKNQVSINPESFPEVAISNPVTLINTQSENEETLIFTYYNPNTFQTHNCHGNLYLWTEETIRALTQAIELKGGNVVQDSEKVIKVSVVGVSTQFNDFTLNLTYNVSVKYETGSDIRKRIIGSQTTSTAGGVFSPFQTWPLDEAISYTIADLLKDEEIINYLNN